MSLTMSDFIDYYFHYSDREDSAYIDKLIFHSTLGKMRFIAALVALCQLTAFIASFSAKHAASAFIQDYRLVYMSLCLLMLFKLVVLWLVKHDIDRRYVWLSWLMPLSVLFIHVWAIIATCVNANALGFVNPSLYIATSLIIPFCVYMHPFAYTLIVGLSDMLMLYVYYTLKLEFTSPAPMTVVIAVIFAIRIAFALMFYFLQFFIRVKSITYEKQQKEISDLNNAQNSFFSSMSHEIRTPINTIIGLNEMILREKVSDEVAEDAANIRAASNMLLHLINDILDMSKISSGQMKLTPVAYRPGDMLSEIVGMLWLRCKEKGLDFHIEIAPDIPSELYGDEVRIKQILINVLNNAIKYTKKGSVTLSIQCNSINDGKADIVYTVKDTGIGIKKESIPYLFTAFKRVDEEKNRYIEGTGLGLSIVKQLTELMGGTVTVNSVYTQGSTFVIQIPQTVNDYTEIGKINLEEKHRSNLSGNYHCSFEAPEAKVLVVDDNESNLLVIRKLLRDTKVQLDTADSGARSLEMTLEKSYDVIFMDHLMPEMDGIECFHNIRNQTGGMSKDAKIVALTANAGSDMRKVYADEGFDGYLVKPVNASELEAELMRMLPANIVKVLHTDENIIENSVSWIDEHKKKRPTVITTESVADIPPSLLKQYGIAIIPHKVITENGVFADGEEIDSDGLLDYMRDSHPVKTHAPTVKEHEEFFAKAIVGANNVIHISISDKVNNSGYEDAKEGAAAFNNVMVFDSSHLSSGQGIVVLEACKLAASGMSAGEVINRLNYIKRYVHTSFIVDNLDYLALSGQVSTRLASIGNALMFHPVIDMKNGVMTTHRFYFGSRTHAWARYVSSTLAAVSDIDKSILFITYVGLTQKDLDLIISMVEKKVKFEHVYCQKASPTIAVNSGPGTFGLLFKFKY